MNTGPDYKMTAGFCERRPDLVCSCGSFQPRVEFFVWDCVWASAGCDPKDVLCVECFEKKLGRPLRLGDFIEEPINHSVACGFQMGVDTVLDRVRSLLGDDVANNISAMKLPSEDGGCRCSQET